MYNLTRKILPILLLGISLVFLDCTEGYGQRSKRKKKKKQEEQVDSNLNNLKLAEQFFTEGEKYFILEDYTKALVFFQKSLELAPGNAAINYKIAEIFNINNDLDNALIHALEAVRLQSNNKYYYLLLAEIYKKQSEYEKAAEVFEVWKALGFISFTLPEPDDLSINKLHNMILGMKNEIDKLKK